jgi:hypothetical protein
MHLIFHEPLFSTQLNTLEILAALGGVLPDAWDGDLFAKLIAGMER